MDSTNNLNASDVNAGNSNEIKPTTLTIPSIQDHFEVLTGMSNMQDADFARATTAFVEALSREDVLPRYFAGQLIFFERTAQATRTKKLMATIALEVAGIDIGQRATISDICLQLGWVDCQVALALMALRSNSVIKWNFIDEAKLRVWATEPSID